MTLPCVSAVTSARWFGGDGVPVSVSTSGTVSCSAAVTIASLTGGATGAFVVAPASVRVIRLLAGSRHSEESQGESVSDESGGRHAWARRTMHGPCHSGLAVGFRSAAESHG